MRKLIEFDNVSVEREGNMALRNVTFSIDDGEHVDDVLFVSGGRVFREPFRGEMIGGNAPVRSAINFEEDADEDVMEMFQRRDAVPEGHAGMHVEQLQTRLADGEFHAISMARPVAANHLRAVRNNCSKWSDWRLSTTYSMPVALSTSQRYRMVARSVEA